MLYRFHRVSLNGDSLPCQEDAQNGNCGGETMAFAFDFDPIHRVLRSAFSGRVGDEDLLNHQRMVVLLATLLDPQFGVADLSAANPFEATSDGMRELAKLPPAMPHANRPRVIVAPSDYAFGMARIFEIEGETTRPNLHVVRSVKEAFAILGVEMDEVKFGPISGVPSAH